LEDLMEAAEGRRVHRGKDIAGGEPVFATGERVFLHGEAGREGFTRGEMPGFYRMTLGIPLSLNRESAAGLSALPGIGPGLAGLIVEERSRRGGFRSLEELTTVRGIGPRLFEKMKPHLVL
jgi:competence protein ComEA